MHYLINTEKAGPSPNPEHVPFIGQVISAHRTLESAQMAQGKAKVKTVIKSVDHNTHHRCSHYVGEMVSSGKGVVRE